MRGDQQASLHSPLEEIDPPDHQVSVKTTYTKPTLLLTTNITQIRAFLNYSAFPDDFSRELFGSAE